MLDRLDLEIFRFQSKLESAGVPPEVVLDYTQRLRQEVMAYAMDALDTAAASLADEIVAKNGKEMVAELRPNYDDFELETESGRTDFTIPPFPMKQNLLKSAKVSSTGTRYKVIPMGDNKTPNPFAVSMADVQLAQSKALKEALSDRVAAKQLSRKGNAEPSFRTVTDKQPDSAWVHPGFDKDFTESLKSVNDSVKSDIEDRIREMIARYEETLL